MMANPVCTTGSGSILKHALTKALLILISCACSATHLEQRMLETRPSMIEYQLLGRRQWEEPVMIRWLLERIAAS